MPGMSASLPWYFARSAGILAWALLSASVVWGLLLSTKAKVGARKPRPAWMLDMHRYLGGLAVVFTVVHVLAVMADKYVHFDPISALVPFAANWHPFAVAWGIASLYLLLAVELTSLVRTKLPKGWWRKVHFATFVLFGTATVHGLSAGTDARSWLFQGVATGVVLLVAGLTGKRVLEATRPKPARPPRRPAAVLRDPAPTLPTAAATPTAAPAARREARVHASV